MFWLLLRVKDFAASHALPLSRCTKGWEGVWPGQLTPNGQRDIPSRECHGQNINLGAVGQEGLIAAQGLAGNQSVGG